MQENTTRFGSMAQYEKGRVEVLNDEAGHYAFSNIFEVASKAVPYEKTAVAKNLEYVVEVLRAEGTSDWFSSSNDEFAVIMEGDIRIELRTIEASIPNPNRDGPGSTTVSPNDLGKKMGVIKLRRGHQALLPQGSAYQFSSESPGVILIQTLCGPLTQEKWSQICQQ